MHYFRGLFNLTTDVLGKETQICRRRLQPLEQVVLVVQDLIEFHHRAILQGQFDTLVSSTRLLTADLPLGDFHVPLGLSDLPADFISQLLHSESFLENLLPSEPLLIEGVHLVFPAWIRSRQGVRVEVNQISGPAPDT